VNRHRVINARADAVGFQMIEQRVALAARVLRQVLVDHGRRAGAEKRGAGQVRVELEPGLLVSEPAAVDVEAVHAALERLAALHARQAEVVSLRVFGGLDLSAIASLLAVSRRTVEGDWTVARAWLRRELAGRIEGLAERGDAEAPGGPDARAPQ